MSKYLFSIHIPNEIGYDEVEPLLREQIKEYKKMNSLSLQLLKYMGAEDDEINSMSKGIKIYTSESENFKSFYSERFESLDIIDIAKKLSKAHPSSELVVLKSNPYDQMELFLYRNGRRISKIFFDDVEENGSTKKPEALMKILNITPEILEEAFEESDCSVDFCKHINRFSPFEFGFFDEYLNENGYEFIEFNFDEIDQEAKTIDVEKLIETSFDMMDSFFDDPDGNEAFDE